VDADEPHAYLLATRDLAPGRGVTRGPSGDRRGSEACATVLDGATRASIDPAAIDYGFVGAAVDSTLVSADADVAPLLADDSRAPHTIRLVALALVRDRARPALTAGPALVAKGDTCTCAGATHVTGEPKWGALVSYDAPAPRVTHATRAIDLLRAALGDPGAAVRVTRVGSLVVDGLAAYLDGTATRPVAFRVTEAAPVAYPLRALAEACPGAFPAPDVTPSPVDFGVAPYGTEATRRVRVVNRAPFDVEALLGVRTVRVPARSEREVPLVWTPSGDAWACETQTRDEAIRFVPADHARAAVPPEQVARVLETVRTGRPVLTRSERIEAPAARRADDFPAVRDWSCPPDFVPAACRAERPACAVSGAPAACAEVRAETRANGCRFTCRAPDRGICRTDATLECRLRCPGTP
jgi:hypothetical protein